MLLVDYVVNDSCRPCVSAQYVDWVKTGDLQAEWDFEPACRAAYEHRAGTDLFKGTHFMRSAPPHSTGPLPCLLSVPLHARILSPHLAPGMCDLPHRGGVTSAAACCALCDERRGQGCQAFTFLAGTCYFKSCGKSGRGGAARSIDGAVSGYLKF